MGDEVVGEHGQPIQVGELGDAGAVQVGPDDLGALEERHFAAGVGADVGEARPAREALGEGDGRSLRRVDKRREASGVLVGHLGSEVAQRGGEQPHELVLGVLAKGVGDLGRLDGAQSSALQGPAAAKRSLSPAATVR